MECSEQDGVHQHQADSRQTEVCDAGEGVSCFVILVMVREDNGGGDDLWEEDSHSSKAKFRDELWREKGTGATKGTTEECH